MVFALFESRMEKKRVFVGQKKLRIDKLAKSIWCENIELRFQTKNWKTEIKELNDILHGVGKILQLLQSERIAVLSILNDSLLQVQCKSSESKHKTYLI